MQTQTQTPALFVRHHLLGGNDLSFEAQVVRGDDESVVATLLISCHTDDPSCHNGMIASCTQLDHANAPGLHSELHVVSCVTATILRAYTEAHELFPDVFIDEDGYRSKLLPLFDPIKV